MKRQHLNRALCKTYHYRLKAKTSNKTRSIYDIVLVMAQFSALGCSCTLVCTCMLRL